ncbi:MAG: TonB family protein [Candidatus Acidiferrales bacterium]
MTLLKDTLEATNSSSETAAAPKASAPKRDQGQLRSDAVSLDVPVKVHGSRVTEVVLGTTPHTEPFEEQTSTMIVFPQGGVLRMAMAVTVGQMMVITNLKSGHDAICRVMKVRAFAAGQSYVEIEFTHRQPGYWGVYFPADASEQAAPAVSAAPPPAPVVVPVAVEVKVEKTDEKPAADISWAPAASMRAPAPASKSPAVPVAAPPQRAAQPSQLESKFTQIGSQEEVQPAASATSALKRSPLIDDDYNSGTTDAAKQMPAIDFPAAPPAAPSPAMSMAELQGDTFAPPSVSNASAPAVEAVEASVDSEGSAAPSPAPTFGRFAASASLGGAHTATREPFGAGLGSGALGLSAHSAEVGQGKGSNWALIVGAVAALVVVVGGAAYHFHALPFGSLASKPASASVTPGAPPVATSAEQNPISNPPNAAASLTAQSNAVSVPTAASAPTVTVQTTSATSAKPSKSEVQAAAAPAKSPAKVPDMFGALNAHPVSPQRAGSSGEAESAPSLDAGSVSGDSGALPEMAAPTVAAPTAPQAAPTGPVRVGGEIKPPRLISSVLPVYPNTAREAGMGGDVVVDTSINESGKVTAMKVVSGPPMLRQAALDALRQWKYEPSKLNGQPIPVQMTVTIRFHRD